MATSADFWDDEAEVSLDLIWPSLADDYMPTTSGLKRTYSSTFLSDPDSESESEEEPADKRTQFERYVERFPILADHNTSFPTKGQLPRREQIGRGGEQDEDPMSIPVIFEPEEVATFENEESKLFNYTRTGSRYCIKHNLHQVNDLMSIATSIDHHISTLVQKHIDQARDTDYISLLLEYPGITPIYTPFVRRDEFDPQSFFNTLWTLSQSARTNFLEEGDMDVFVSIVKDYEGSRLTNSAPTTSRQVYHDMSSVVKIYNDNHLCGYLALILGKLKADGVSGRRWETLRRKDSKQLWDEMLLQCRNYGICTESPLRLSDFQFIQSQMADYQIIIVKRPEMRIQVTEPLFKGEPEKLKQIILEYDESNTHYNTILKINCYYGFRYFCTSCWVGNKERKRHLKDCKKACPICLRSPACCLERKIHCNKCNQTCFGPACFDEHNLECSKKVKCSTCEQLLGPKDVHKCDHSMCPHCKAIYHKAPHYCIIKGENIQELRKKDRVNKIIVAFDVETRTEIRDGRGSIHEANLVVGNTVCYNCMEGKHSALENDTNPSCDTCGHLVTKFFGDDCIDNFIDYLMTLSHKAEELNKGNVHIYVLAHNLKGFDGRFIYKNLYTRKYHNIDAIINGTKILRIDVGNMRFLDSNSFFGCKLAALPKIFGFEKIATKGFFPYLFNRKENYEYLGQVPDLKYFNPTNLSGKDLNDLKKWHHDLREGNYVFNFMRELEYYCCQDVRVLMLATLRFRTLLLQATGIDFLTRCFTLASLSQEIYYSTYYNEPIGQTPVDGYLKLRNRSKIASCWIDYQETIMNCSIEREQRIGPYHVDGLIRDQMVVFEYYGCHWHACPCTYEDPNTIVNKKTEETAADRRRKEQERREYLQRRGYSLIEMRDCEIGALRAENPSLHQFVRQRSKMYTEIEDLGDRTIRDALFGGRTENFRFITTCEENEEIKYKDFTSLYPSVLKTEKFPLGHPQVILNPEIEKIHEYFGFITCKIIPPRSLRFPVLASRIRDKLMFVLCGRCAQASTTQFCKHSDEQRALTGTWTSVDIASALKYGYRISKLTVVQHFESSSDQLFAGYINKFLKLKQESSGFPDYIESITDDVEKETAINEYIKMYYEREGILLDRANIEKNPGKRQIAKLLLNCLWGRFALRDNLPQTKILTSFTELWNYLVDPDIRITSEFLIDPDTMMITYEHINPVNAPASKTSPSLASFVTAYARSRLADAIQKIALIDEEAVAYCDTDSIIYKIKDGVDPLEKDVGPFLGQFTDEIQGKVCKEAAFAGPKSYLLLMTDKKSGEKDHIMKIKGVSLKGEALDAITPVIFRNMTKAYAETKDIMEITIPQELITARKTEQVLRTIQQPKSFCVTGMDKRLFIGNTSYPFGYKN